jgi:hypothetical protein
MQGNGSQRMIVHSGKNIGNQQQEVTCMQNIKPLLIKIAGHFIFLYLVLGFIYGMSFFGVLFTALLLSVISYFLADLGLLPRTADWFVLILDFGLAFSVIWGMTRFFAHNHLPGLQVSIGAAVVISVFEHFYHQYLTDYVLQKGVPRRSKAQTLRYGTETAEEIRPETGKKQQ